MYTADVNKKWHLGAIEDVVLAGRTVVFTSFSSPMCSVVLTHLYVHALVIVAALRCSLNEG